MTIQCCRCKKVQRNGEWTAAPEGAQERVSHSYCPVCLETSRAEIRNELARANAAERHGKRLPIVASTLKLRGV